MASYSGGVLGRGKVDQRRICRSLGFRKGKHKRDKVVSQFEVAGKLWYPQVSGHDQGGRQAYYTMPDSEEVERALRELELLGGQPKIGAQREHETKT